jgi:HlyD family secretion protein
VVTRYLFPILAVAGLVVAFFVVSLGRHVAAPLNLATIPALPPFDSCICGAGIIEACSENIRVGAPSTGMVEKIFVQTGQAVQQGEPLFRLDTRGPLAELRLQRAELEVASAKLTEAETEARDVRAQLACAEQVRDARALSREELDKRRNAVATAEARIATARAEVQRHRAKVNLLEVQLERLTVCAPIDGVILQKNIHLGECVLIGEEGGKLMLLGVANPMRVRVDIDETDAWRFSPGASAIGVLRGNAAVQIPLKFLDYEPYVIPKRSLTGAARERVDTRVLQALYQFDPTGYPVYMGGQLDVYIQASAP